MTQKATSTKIDVHCHLFNKKIASIPLLLDIIKSLLSSGRPAATGEQIIADSTLTGKVSRYGKLLALLFSSDEDALLRYLISYEQDTVFVPLMFDLKYAAYSKDAVNALKEMKSGLQSELENHYEQSNDLQQVSEEGFEKLFREIDEIMGKDENLLTKSSSDTFDMQYDQLIALRKKHPEAIKPFFAVDSRREDAYERMVKAIEKDGFAGVKMYCPNGYSPLDPRLDKAYRYCLDNNIPITAHCSYGGFATLENKVDVKGAIYKAGQVVQYDGELTLTNSITKSGGVAERALALNHPDLWNTVLRRYKGLKLNLAHMGIAGADSEEKRYEWSNLILKMMLEHEYLYTDFSCMTDIRDIAYLWELAAKTDRNYTLKLKITDRIMFGTDFWLNMIFEDMEEYMNNFKQVFANKQQDLIRIQQMNPRRFLNM